MAEADRIQFRISKRRFARLLALADRNNVSPSRLAKRILEDVLDREDLDPDALFDELLVIRAGIEQMFARSDPAGELADAVERLRLRRETTANLYEEGGEA